MAREEKVDMQNNNTHFGTGAVKDLPDSRDLLFGAIESQVGADNAPSFEEGYDVESIYGELTQKDQNGSLSCVAQATSYYAEMLEKIESGNNVSLSPRFIYSQIHFPEGAAYVRDGISTLVEQGISPETLCPSYPNDEISMRQLPSPEAREAAKIYKAKSYASVAPSFEQFRKALFTGKGLLTAFTGSNPSWHVDSNGFIRPPASTDDRWGHCVFIVGYGIRNGRKGFKIKNTWRKEWGVNGYAWVGEDYFNAENNSLVFSGWTLVDLPDKYQPETMFNLMKGNGSNVYAIAAGKKHLIVNLDSYKAGVEQGLWLEEIHDVTQAVLDEMPEGSAIILINNN